MFGHTFKGGVHPSQFKQLTLREGITSLPLPERIIIPLQQHTGAVCEPLVKKGDYVKSGQKIGDSQAFISAPVHSSISGKVIEIKSWAHPVGGRVNSVVIESNGKDEWVEPPEHEEYFRSSPGELVQIIRQAGIVGLGGAAFPTHVKLSPPKDKFIDTVILNGCECEPYLTCDYRLMLEYPHEIIEGFKIIMYILRVKQGIVAIEDNKPEAIFRMREEVKKQPDMSLVVLKTKYPQGAEKQLIKALLNKEVPSGGLPLDVGAVVQNVGTALAINEAVSKGKPLVERVITVTGNGILQPRNLKVRLGTLFSDLINFCGGFAGQPGKVIMGGPMMGIAQAQIELPIIKGTCGILVLPEEEVSVAQPEECIGCGRCVEYCPMNLLPNKIALYSEHKRWELAKEYGAMDCIECGVCGYVCPAKRWLVQYIKWAKQEIGVIGSKKTS